MSPSVAHYIAVLVWIRPGLRVEGQIQTIAVPVEQILVCLTRVAYSIAIVVTQASYEVSLSRHDTIVSVCITKAFGM